MRKTCMMIAATVALSLSCLLGCAFTDSTVKLKFDISDSSEKVVRAQEITIKPFVDARKVGDPNFVYYRNDIFGKTSGRLSSEDMEVAGFVTDVIRKTAQDEGFTVVDNSNFILTGRLLSLDSRVIVGFWGSTLETSMNGSIKLTKGSHVIFSEPIMEKAELPDVHVEAISHYEEVLEKMFKSLSESVRELLKSAFPMEQRAGK